MPKATILVADDSPTQQKLICAAFKEQDFTLVCVNDGAEALAAVERGEQDFALAILDVIMPNMNGFQACKKIKKLKKDLPIILLTTKDTRSDEFWGLHQGADLYMTKPFAPGDLCQNVLKLMGML